MTSPGGGRPRASTDGSAASGTSATSAASAMSDVAKWMPITLGETAKPKPIFNDITNMKDKVRDALRRPEYNVKDYYKDEGWAQHVAKSQWFENATLAVITLNAVWIWVDTDYNGKTLLEADPIFQVAEHFFCLYFTAEWVTRFCAFRLKRHCLHDGWFVFDSMLVFTMVLETWVLSLVLIIAGGNNTNPLLGNATILRMARLLRLSRMTRMARLFRAMPELMILIKGMAAASRSVFFTIMLLIIVLYVFGIAFVQLTEDSDVGSSHFGSVGAAMYTLFLSGTLMDGTAFVASTLADEHYAFTALYFLFVLLAAMTVMNMLIGVICEVVSATAYSEKEEMAVSDVKFRLQSIRAQLDTNHDGMISKNEFEEILSDKRAAATLHGVGVDVVNLVDFADTIFEKYIEVENMEHRHCECGNVLAHDSVYCRKCGEKWQLSHEDEVHSQSLPESQVSFNHFMEECLRLRGTNYATVTDIVCMQKYVKKLCQNMTKELSTKIEDSAKRSGDRILQELGISPAPAAGGVRRSSSQLARPERASRRQSEPLGFAAGQVAEEAQAERARAPPEGQTSNGAVGGSARGNADFSLIATGEMNSMSRNGKVESLALEDEHSSPALKSASGGINEEKSTPVESGILPVASGGRPAAPRPRGGAALEISRAEVLLEFHSSLSDGEDACERATVEIVPPPQTLWTFRCMASSNTNVAL